MDDFAFRDELVAEYERFFRSFTRIRADDISRAVDDAYAAGRFWPAPLINEVSVVFLAVRVIGCHPTLLGLRRLSR